MDTYLDGSQLHNPGSGEAAYMTVEAMSSLVSRGGFVPTNVFHQLLQGSAEDSYLTVEEMQMIAGGDGGYMTATEMRQLGALSRDGGYMTASQIRDEHQADYLTAEAASQSGGRKPGDAGYFAPQGRGTTGGTSVDNYLTAEAAGVRQVSKTGDGGYFTPGRPTDGRAGDASSVSSAPAGGDSGYMSIQTPGDLPDYMTLEAIQSLAPADGGYLSLAALRELSRDGGYLTAAALQGLLSRARDNGYLSLMAKQGVDESLYMEVPASQRSESTYQEASGPGESLWGKAGQRPELMTAKHKKLLAKLKKAREARDKQEQAQGRKDRLKLRQKQLKEENAEKRRLRKKELAEAKQKVKDDKKRAAQAIKAQKNAEKEQLKEVQRRMTLSKKALKNASTRRSKSSLDEQETAVRSGLQRTATHALQLDEKETKRRWNKLPPEQRYRAVATQKRREPECLFFIKGDLIAVTEKKDGGYFIGMCVKTGRTGVLHHSLVELVP